MSHNFRLYHINTPKEKTMVNFIFTDHMPDCFKCHLIDYGVDAIMPLHLATTKTSIKSIKSLAPLNKPMVGIVEEITNGHIVISMAYVDRESDTYKSFGTTSDQMRKMVSVVKRYATMNKKDYVEYWEQTFYPIDMSRPDDTTLFDHIFDSIEVLDQPLIMMLQALTIKRVVNPTHFKMISQSGICKITEIIDAALVATGLRGKVSIVMDTPPKYIITSTDDTIDESHHAMFKTKLKELSQDFDVMIE